MNIEKNGDTLYTRYEESTINGLKDDAYYDVRTTLIDVTGNEVSSEAVTIYIESLTPDVEFEISTFILTYDLNYDSLIYYQNAYWNTV